MFGSGHFKIPVYYLHLLPLWSWGEMGFLLFPPSQSLAQWLVHGEYLLLCSMWQDRISSEGWVLVCPRDGLLHPQVETRTSAPWWIGHLPRDPSSWAFENCPTSCGSNCDIFPTWTRDAGRNQYYNTELRGVFPVYFCLLHCWLKSQEPVKGPGETLLLPGNSTLLPGNVS